MSSETANTNPWTKSASPWGKPAAPVQPCSLQDVMSEQLASELQNKEDNIINQDLQLQETLKLSEATAGGVEESSPSLATVSESNLSDAELAAKLAAEEEMSGCDPNDEKIALMLQKEFDREYDAALSKRETKYNGNSKVAISFDNYKRRHVQAEYQNDDEEEEDYDDDEVPEHPTSTEWDSSAPSIGSRGFVGQGKNVVTKHDSVICGRRNAQKLMQFPPDFDCGDGEGMDMQLPNRVYNKLKRHSQSESKRGHKVFEKKDHSTAIKAVDEKTRILIYKMINNEFLTSVDGVVSEGKEAVVLKAAGGKREDDVELPKDVILKVYKTSMNEFKTRLKYIRGDYRLSKDLFKKFNPRKVMRMWAEKEFLNLKKLRRNGIPCPSALALKKHILAMDCIGGEKPAPKLKDVVFSTENLQDAYEQTVDLMKNMYSKCNMVHSDFSEYNLLWHEGKVWVIDVGQAVDRENASSNSFLLRDCKNICDFFKQAGVYDVPTAENLYNEITNRSLQGEGRVFESQTQRYEKEEYAFDYFFELSESSRAQRLNLDESDSDSDDDEGEEIEDLSEEDEEEEEEKLGESVVSQKNTEEGKVSGIGENSSSSVDGSGSCVAGKSKSSGGVSTVNGKIVVD